MNIGDSLANGIADKAEAVGNAVQKLADIIQTGITIPMQIESPSKVMKRYGNYIAEGLAFGIRGGVGTVRDATRAMTDAVKTEAGLTAAGGRWDRNSRPQAEPWTEARMIDAFRGAMSGMKVMLDGRVAGDFIEHTVRKRIYS